MLQKVMEGLAKSFTDLFAAGMLILLELQLPEALHMIQLGEIQYYKFAQDKWQDGGLYH